MNHNINKPDNEIASGSKDITAIDYEIWDEIQNDLGDITDFRIVVDPSQNSSTFAQIHFKSNGIDKVMACNDGNFKFFIAASYYCARLLSPIKTETTNDNAVSGSKGIEGSIKGKDDQWKAFVSFNEDISLCLEKLNDCIKSHGINNGSEKELEKVLVPLITKDGKITLFIDYPSFVQSFLSNP
jgi:hypothetical protein